MSGRRGSVGAATGMVPDLEINQRAEKADRRPARTPDEMYRADVRRKKTYTPEYQAWLERQGAKRSRRAAETRGRNP